MVYSKHDWQDGELITSDKLNNIEEGVDNSTLYINVKDFGAVGDNLNDDTQGFLTAISKANETGKPLFIPSGNYIVNKQLVIDGTFVFGAGETKTKIVSTADYAISLDYRAYISDFSIDVSKNDNGVALNFGSVIDESNTNRGMSSRAKNITIFGNDKNSIGILMSPMYKDISTNVNDTYNELENIRMFTIGTGILLDSKKYGYVNSNIFSNIFINGYTNNGIVLDSTGINSRDIQHNTFRAIKLESLPNTKSDSSAVLVKAGKHNVFDDISLFNDSGFSVKNFSSGTSVGYSPEWKISNNIITNSKVEGTNGLSNDFMGLNDVDFILTNSINSVVSSYSVGNYHVTSKKQSIIVTDAIENVAKNYGLPKVSTNGISDLQKGYDNISHYLQYSMGPGKYLKMGLDNLPYEKIKTSKKLSVHVYLNTSDITQISNIVVNAMFVSSTGDQTWRAPIYFETQTSGNNEFVVKAIYSISDADLSANQKMGILLGGITGTNTVKIRKFTASDRWVLDENNITDKPSKKLINYGGSINSFDDAGVYYVAELGISFSSDMVLTQTIGTKTLLTSDAILL